MDLKRLRQILDRADSKRILVIGDLMLDEFVWGKVGRISPEAPVPVVEVTGESFFPGGAANVARNLREFIAKTSVIGMIGKDRSGQQLRELLAKGKIDVSKGHHDAGDYSKYTINTAGLIHYLMFAVDSFSGVAALDNLGIPESGDGISDLMQIAKWEADYIAKLQDADGGFYFLVYPRDREYESNVERPA